MSLYKRQTTAPNLPLRTPPVLRSRTASMGDVLTSNKNNSPIARHRRQSAITNSGQGLGTRASSSQGLGARTSSCQKMSRKSSVASIGCHISSLLSLSSQVKEKKEETNRKGLLSKGKLEKS